MGLKFINDNKNIGIQDDKFKNIKGRQKNSRPLFKEKTFNTF